MSYQAPIAPAAEPASRSIEVIAATLEAHTGQRIAQNRMWRVETSLKPLLREHGLCSLDALANRLAEGRDARLIGQVIDALLNQETSFFRDGGVLEEAVDAVLAMDFGTMRRRARIWSAGCSTGQEPLSLAILLSERLSQKSGVFPEIQATDVSESAIARAQAGRYSQFEIQRGMPIRRMITWFDGNDEVWSAKAELIRRITYRRASLLDDPPIGQFDLILCRNVLFYFSAEVRARAFGRIAEVLRPGGLLALGAGETVIGQTRLLKPSAAHRGFYERAD
ncbi:CheR family methyltransferase [Sphingomonas aestuarii]